jgi:23S rRNA (uracil1939-C5)-methyltransferase
MTFDLEIETLTVGGRGLGRHAGKAVFVPCTAPGDHVRCRITRGHRHFDEAETVELLVPSGLRRQPPCPVFGLCGGCQWQHLSYDTQVGWKERLFREQLLRAGVVAPDAFLPIEQAPEEWGYRNRVQFKCRRTAQGFVSGFYRHGSHFVVDTPDCLLADHPIRAAYACLRTELPVSPQPDAIPQVDISSSADGSVAVLLHALPDAAVVLRQWLPDMADRGGFAAAIQCGRKESIEVLCGEADMAMVIDSPPLQLRIGPGGFAQINPDQNRRLVAAVVAAATLSGNERVLDLYCGVGNFTLPLARRAGSVVGVESYAPAITNAIDNAARHALDNVTFHVEPAEGAALRHGPCDLVLLDPPRSGAYPVMRDLLVLKPRRILYVSCDPATLARDLKPLVNSGYTVVSCQPFDLFPQTWHTESLTVLARDL